MPQRRLRIASLEKRPSIEALTMPHSDNLDISGAGVRMTSAPSSRSTHEVREATIAAERVRQISSTMIHALRDEFYSQYRELGIERIQAIIEDVARAL